MATIDVDGVQREASLLLVEDAVVGEYVIVHAGFAIQRIDEAAAKETLNLLREAAELVALKKPKNGWMRLWNRSLTGL